MSIRVMSRVFELDVPPLEKLVLLAMADHARDDGSGCYPSLGRLALKTSLSERGVRYVIRRLQARGFLVSKGNAKGGRGLTTEYEITLEKGARGAGFRNEKGARHDTKRGHSTAEKGAPGAPESLRTVRREPSEAEEAEAGASAPAAASAHPAFRDLLCEEPFGHPRFQTVWIEEWEKISSNGGGVVAAMERTAKRCQREGIRVPKVFFDIKREQERVAIENHYHPHRTQL